MYVDASFDINGTVGVLRGWFNVSVAGDSVELWWNLVIPSFSIYVDDSSVSIEGFYFDIGDFMVSADAILFVADGLLIVENTTEGILITTDMGAVVDVDNLYLLLNGIEISVGGGISMDADGLILVDLPGGHLLVDGADFSGFVDFDMNYNGTVTSLSGTFAFDGFVEVYWDLVDLYLNVSVDALASVSDFSFMYGDSVVFNVSELSLSGDGSVVVENKSGDAIQVSALGVDVSLTDLYLRFGDTYVNVTGTIVIEAGTSIIFYSYL